MKEVSIQFFCFQEYNTVMHELEITQHILADSIREAERHGAKAIREIRLNGEYDRAVRRYFPFSIY